MKNISVYFLFFFVFLTRPGYAEPEQKVIYKNKVFTFVEREYELKVRSRDFRQGNLAVVNLIFKENSGIDPARLEVKWQEKKVSLFMVKPSVYIGFFGVHPEMKPGKYPLSISNNAEQGKFDRHYNIKIEETPFEEKLIEIIRLPGKYSKRKKWSKETIEFIKQCESIKRKAFESDSPLQFAGTFRLPLPLKKITSQFYSRRSYSKSKRGKPHGGVDLRGAKGDPIYSIQDGRVIISMHMYFEGIFTVIDHGSKIFSLYMHQSRTRVKVGEAVKKGELIGYVGSTGLSTGPHLHLGLKIENTLVDPLSAMGLKVY